MLKVIFGEMEDSIYAPNIYFDNTYEPEWITSDFGRRVIADIDKSTVISENIIDSPILGPITPRQIAGGTKTLFLMEFDDSQIYNASTCGNNCAKWILDIASRKDLTINLLHIMEFGDGPFEILILNTNTIVRNDYDYFMIAKNFV